MSSISPELSEKGTNTYLAEMQLVNFLQDFLYQIEGEFVRVFANSKLLFFHYLKHITFIIKKLFSSTYIINLTLFKYIHSKVSYSGQHGGFMVSCFTTRLGVPVLFV